MQRCTLLAIFAACLAVAVPLHAADEAPAAVPHVNHRALVSLKWQLLASTDPFIDKTVFEMIDLLHGMTIHHLVLTRQPLSPQHRDIRVGPDMPADQLTALLAKLKSVHMDAVTWDPGMSDNPNDWGLQLDFAKKIGAKNVLTLQHASHALDQLANEFGVNIVSYYPPDQLDAAVILKDFDGLSPRSGLLATVGEWQKPHADPVAMIHALGNRIIEVHLSDVNSNALQVPLGTGIVDLSGVCAELKRQNFHGQFEVQWMLPPLHTAWQQQVSQFVQSVDGFSDAVGKVTGIAEK